MMKETPITKDALEYYAGTNLALLKTPAKALVLEFHGLGGMADGMAGDSELGRYLAERGVAYAIPYYGPWGWMADKAVKYVNEVVDAIFDALGGEVPIVSMGGSMGGLSALVYCVYAKHTPAACFANCPVADLPYHRTERVDLPRTVYVAFNHYDCTLDEAMKSASPLHLADRMPRIPYLIYGATADSAVSMERHATPFVEAMRALGHDVEYVVNEGFDHCGMDEAGKRRYFEFCATAWEK